MSVLEATKALGFLGIIDSAPRPGFTPAVVDMSRVLAYLGLHSALTHYPKAQLLQTRLVFYTGTDVARRVMLDNL